MMKNEVKNSLHFIQVYEILSLKVFLIIGLEFMCM